MGTPSVRKSQRNIKEYLLVLRCQVGDVAAFRALYNLLSDRSLSFLRSFVTAEEAQDLNQELWLVVYKRISSLANPDGFKTWLFQSARNKALDHLRSQKRFDALSETLRVESEHPVEMPTYESSVFQNDELVRTALEGLSARHREVLVLNFLEGMDYQEIALITGCSLGTVKSRLHHAKLKLKEIITQNLPS